MGEPSIHPLWLRIMHWANATAVILLVLSGWRIYNATRFMFGFRFPSEANFHIFSWHIKFPLMLGGWLGGALQWHFAAMWILVVNAVLYVVINIATKRWGRQFLPLTPKSLWEDIVAFVRGKLAHADLSHYNAIQKLAYLFAMADIIALILSGMVLWKSVQFGWLRWLFNGYEGARYVHFIAMSLMCGFIIVHVVMALLVPRTIKAMVWGR